MGYQKSNHTNQDVIKSERSFTEIGSPVKRETVSFNIRSERRHFLCGSD